MLPAAVTAPAPFCVKGPARVITVPDPNVNVPELVTTTGPPAVVFTAPLKAKL